ncbi:hypothetical protein ACFL5O_01455 [Myxococcota bacterium]
MKSILRLAAVVVSACVLTCCGGKAGAGAKSPDKESAKKDGCPDEDPFCAEGEGGSTDDSEDVTPSGSSESSGLSTSTSAGNSDAIDPADASTEIVVLKVQRRTPPDDKTDKDKDGKAKKKAKKKVKGKKKEEAEPARVILHPKGLSYGMGAEQIAKLYDRVLDAQYVALYKKTPIGPQTEALDDELRQMKRILRQNKLPFGNMPTGMDNTSLKNEYTYNNNESMTKIDLGNGLVRNFFFFDDRLWKIYDEHTVGKTPIGPSYEAAVQYVKDKMGVEGTKLEPGGGRDFELTEWRDGTTLVRLVNRDFQKVIGLVFVEESVEKKLPSLRRNRKRSVTSVDSAVDAATRPKTPPPDEKDKKKTKKKK